MGLPLTVLPQGSGPGVREMDLAPDSGLRNRAVWGRSNPGTINAIVTDAGVLAAASDWTDIPVNRQRMPISATPVINLIAGLGATETIQFRMWGFNLRGQAVFEESPRITVTTVLATALNYAIVMSKCFAFVTRIQYKLTGLQWSNCFIGFMGYWNREATASAWSGGAPANTFIDIIGRTHIGLEVPMLVEPKQAAQEFELPQILSLRVTNHTDPAGFDADNVAELQPTTDAGGSLGGFILGDSFLNTETIKGWAGDPNKVRLVCVPGSKTVRADSGATTFRFHTATGAAFAADTIYYYLEARSGVGTRKTFALPL